MSRPSFMVASCAAAACSVMVNFQEPLRAPAALGAFKPAVRGPAPLPLAHHLETHALPGWVRCVFQIAGEVGKLLDLRWQHCRFHTEMLIVRDGTQHFREAAAF